MSPAPWGWRLVALISVCLGVLAVDVGHLPGFPDWSWTLLYSMACFGLVLWRATFRAAFLVAATYALFIASFARAVAFAIWDSDRMAGIALNVLMAVFAALTLRSQARWAR